MKSIYVTTSWDDGHPLDLKILSLLEKYRLKGTFYIPIANTEKQTMDEVTIKEISSIAEIGGHTVNHTNLIGLNNEDLKYEIRIGKKQIEEIIEKPISMFCYPKGKYDKRAKKAVEDAGFIGARTAEQFRIVIHKDLFTIPTTCLAFDRNAYINYIHSARRLNLRGLIDILKIGAHRHWADIARELFLKLLERGGIWHLWGHSWQIEENQQWDKLERLLDFVSRRSGIKYLTNGEMIQELNKKVKYE